MDGLLRDTWMDPGSRLTPNLPHCSALPRDTPGRNFFPNFHFLNGFRLGMASGIVCTGAEWELLVLLASKGEGWRWHLPLALHPTDSWKSSSGSLGMGLNEDPSLRCRAASALAFPGFLGFWLCRAQSWMHHPKMSSATSLHQGWSGGFWGPHSPPSPTQGG